MMPRARDLGIPFDGTPGPYNAITDVPGVSVGYTTLVQGEGKLVVGQGPVRTGVTVILPRGPDNLEPVYAAYFSFNGAGEMTGLPTLDEWAWLFGPIGITNTHSVGVVRDALVDWNVRRGVRQRFFCPVVAETFDGLLNDVNGFHVRADHVHAALSQAHGGAIAEGNVGGGTGMIAHGWKGGTGTASRQLAGALAGYTVGVLVQANYGERNTLRIASAPVGREILEPVIAPGLLAQSVANQSATLQSDRGSIIVIIATDVPLLPFQLRTLAKRPTLALGRMGSLGGESSGDLFLAFSTQTPRVARELEVVPSRLRQPDYEADRAALLDVATLPLGQLSPVSAAVVEATEEAIVNAMIAAKDLRGADDVFVPALPHTPLQDVLRKYNWLS